jgi:predicted  nucleic acid-binding Zn ribbon protein
MSFLPENLVYEIGNLLAAHVGLERAVRLSEIRSMIYQQSSLFRTVNNRQVRSAIESLREMGWLICSLGGDSDGYYLAKDKAEYSTWRSYYLSYATTIFSRIKRMDKEAEKKWGGSALQAPLL